MTDNSAYRELIDQTVLNLVQISQFMRESDASDSDVHMVLDMALDLRGHALPFLDLRA